MDTSNRILSVLSKRTSYRSILQSAQYHFYLDKVPKIIFTIWQYGAIMVHPTCNAVIEVNNKQNKEDQGIEMAS